MLKLKNVSKFYYSNGVVTSGFTKVNLELHKGEFVAITGESGSGKSTLLNVISGLDTYEEGEMYINGEETNQKLMDLVSAGSIDRADVFHDFGKLENAAGKPVSKVEIMPFWKAFTTARTAAKSICGFICGMVM